ncbi:hypothetical protein [Candidatus Berkiella aquae]|uniref:Uncharacterized protein n=1 Tax=Candidatus Berkiella aquae TaxID=295108 RepID=A0A0Q9YLQ8_9GAMM|nr:hypothetical protein [Candidatus Berkiella aquae]MCS5710600.1 hypothetical protein [Candidatus Berkiella aquae]
MPYQLRHLQHAVNYIVEQLRYNDPRKGLQTLNASTKRQLADELLLAIDPLQLRNPKNIAINPSNSYLKDFFLQLAERNIVYPEATTYLLKRNNITYECHDGERKEIYNRQKAKANVKASRMSELQEQLSEQLSALELDDYSDSEVSDEETQAYLPYHGATSSKLQTVYCNQQIAHLASKARM